MNVQFMSDRAYIPDYVTITFTHDRVCRINFTKSQEEEQQQQQQLTNFKDREPDSRSKRFSRIWGISKK